MKKSFILGGLLFLSQISFAQNETRTTKVPYHRPVETPTYTPQEMATFEQLSLKNQNASSPTIKVNGSLPNGSQPTAPPEAGAINRFQDVSVNLFTGSAVVPLPLYTLTDGALQVPISLDFNASGIKAEEVASWVGLGWNLNAGGMISRMTKDKPDEGKLDMISGNWSSYDHRKGYYFNGIKGNHPVTDDLQPDVFFLSVGGASYKFMYKYDNEPRFIFMPDADITVKPTFVSKSGSSSAFDIVKFEVTMPDGTMYVFGDGAYEKSAEIDLAYADDQNVYPGQTRFNHYWNAEAQTSVWYLKKIISPYGQEINFSYNNTNYSFFKLAESQAPNEICPTPTEVDKTINKVYVQSAAISTISSSNYKVEFNKKFTECVGTEVGEFCFLNTLAPSRLDIDQWSQTPQNQSSSKLLLEMMVMDNVVNPSDTLFYKFDFGYFTGATDDLPSGYTASNTGSGLKVGTSHQKRLRLEKVTMPDQSNYRFRYRGDGQFYNGKSRLDMGIDHWGYSNGHTSNRVLTGLIPRDEDYPNCTPNTSDRDTDASFGFYGNLDSIIVSTGSRIAFDYELHRAANYMDGSAYKPIGGSRIKSIRFIDEISEIETLKKYDYTEQDGSTPSGYMVLKPVYRYYRHSTGVNGSNSGIYMRLLGSLGRPPVGYSRVTETITDKFDNPIGKTVYRFDQSKDEINFRKPYCYYNAQSQYVCDSNLIDILLYEISPYFDNPESHQYNTGNLLDKTIFNQSGDTLLVSAYNYTQSPVLIASTQGRSVFKVNGENFGHFIYNGQNQYWNFDAFAFYKYRLEKETQKVFSPDGSNPLVSSTEYVYKDEMPSYYQSVYPGKHNAPVKTITTDSRGHVIESLAKYVADFGGFGLDTTIETNYCYDPIENYSYPCDTTVYIDHVPLDNTEIRAIFEMQSKKMLYGVVESTTKDNDYLTAAAFNSFGKHIVSNAIFDYYLKKTYSFGGIGSSSFNEVFYYRPSGDTLFKDGRYFPVGFISDYNKFGFPIEQKPFGGALSMSKFDNSETIPALSIFNPNGNVTDSISNTYTQKLFGLSSKKGVNGLEVKYDYYHATENNKTGQIKSIRDKNDFILSQFENPYRGQNLQYSTGNLSTDITKNRSVTRTPRIATTNFNQDFEQVSTAISYADGSGRNLQNVGYGLSPKGNDLISGGLEFDSYGRPKKSFLPSPKSNRNGFFDANFSTTTSTFYQDTTAFSIVSEYENSPLSRVFKSIGPGVAFRPQKTENQTFETGNFGLSRIQTDYYGIIQISNIIGNEAFKQISYDADSNATFSFTDKEGRMLESWVQFTGDGSDPSHFLKTTYIYDYLGRQVAVLPPLLYGQITNGTNILSSAFIDYIYFVKYDSRGRAVESHVPDGGWSYHVFNRLGQEVLTQNARQRETDLWEWTKYGARGQAVLSGILTQNTFSRSQIQQFFDDFTEDKQFEERTASGGQEGYSIRSFPSQIQALITNADIQTVNYFDDYSWQVAEALEATLAFKKYKTDRWPNSKGLLTGTKVRRLDSNQWLASAMYYDDKNRLIQTQSENRFGAINQSDMVLDFIGQLDEERTIYRKSSTEIDSLIEIKNNYTYDHAGRKLQVINTFNGKAELLASYEYDELGRLKQKNLNEARTDSIIRQNPVLIPKEQDIAKRYILLEPGTCISGDSVYLGQIAAGLQKVAYSYDIRGNLRCINCDSLDKLDSSKVFAMKLDYFQDGRFFNGLLSKQTWLADSVQRSYLYDYDKANRLKSGVFSGQIPENYSVPKITYDANGNVDSLQRFGQTASNTFGLIDDLKYKYPTNSNQLTAIDDNADASKGFENVPGSSDFTYYADGFQKSDSNKGITNIEYNYLGLIDKIHFGANKRIENTYTADGVKLKTLFIAGTDTLKKEYVGDLIYINDTLRSIWHDEGRVILDPQFIFTSWSDTLGNTYADTSLALNARYQYFINDHLGSPRVVFQKLNDSLFIAQRINYGVTGDIVTLDSTDKNLLTHLFQGKEWLDGFGYEFVTRTYDPYTMRMLQIDGANQFASGYVGMGNNPVSMIDPDGQFAFVPVLLAVGKAIAVGAAIGGASYGASVGLSNGGFNNWNWDQFGRSVGIGAVSGAVSFGIGSAASAIGGVGGFAVQTAGHAAWGGVNSVMNGGDFWSGAASGAIGNIAGDLTSNMKPVFQIGASALAGGVGAKLSGNDFWRGAAIGGIVAGANHLMHPPKHEYNGRVYNSKDELYFAILQDQSMEQLGIKDILALAAGLDNAFPSIEKPFTTPGASSKTSYASKYGSKILPNKMPNRLPTHLNKAGKVVYTKVLGRFVGRVAGPIGWGLLAYDVGRIFYNTQNIYNSIIAR
jgi:hypothetical protein